MYIAIIGSGPSAFYTCQSLIKSKDNIKVDIIEKLPTPFGLVRYGVAPDHQKTKNIIKLFSKILENKNVNFFGNINVGSDVSVQFISENYDAVVLASGAENDKKLNISGENKKGIYGSGQFVGWYNGIPKYKELNPNLNTKNVIIIGNGNVALDCARLLAKGKNEFYNSDITEYSLNSIVNSSIENIYIIGRRSPLEAKFTIAELRELGKLNSYKTIIDYPKNYLEEIMSTQNLDTKIKKNIEILLDYKKNNSDKKNSIIFKFLLSPSEIIGKEQVASVKFRKNILENNILNSTEDFEEIEAGLVISAIGYDTNQINDLPLNKYNNHYLNESGYIVKNIYVTGWAANTSVGVIGSNKIAASEVSDKILKEIVSKKENSSKKLISYLNSNNKRFITKEDWIRIDKKELSEANEKFVRKKEVDLEEIFSFLKA